MPTDLFCTFCGKRAREVYKLIAGPGVAICNECVELCSDIIVEQRKADRAATDERVAQGTRALVHMLAEAQPSPGSKVDELLIQLAKELAGRMPRPAAIP